VAEYLVGEPAHGLGSRASALGFAALNFGGLFAKSFAICLAAVEAFSQRFVWDGLRFFWEIWWLRYYYTHGYCFNPAFLILLGVPGFFLSEKPSLLL
jgi:hypothetical protein